MGRWSFWDDYRPLPPRPVEKGIKAKSQRGAIGETWWSKRWIQVLESFGMGARLNRGRSYARMGQVISIDIQKGIVTAKVQGTRPNPYSVNIQLNPLSDKDWDKVMDAMASQAIFAAKLLSGEMPHNIEEAFREANIPLFPKSIKDLHTDCSCPDWANPCKHIAAVYFLLAENFDEDPFLIFKLRGRTKEEIIALLREKRASALPEEVSTFTESDSPPVAAVPLENCLDTFWKAGEALDSFSISLVPPEVDSAILKRLGDAPFTIRKHNLASLLARAYSVASLTALQKTSGEVQEEE